MVTQTGSSPFTPPAALAFEQKKIKRVATWRGEKRKEATPRPIEFALVSQVVGGTHIGDDSGFEASLKLLALVVYCFFSLLVMEPLLRDVYRTLPCSSFAQNRRRYHAPFHQYPRELPSPFVLPTVMPLETRSTRVLTGRCTFAASEV